MTSASTSRAYVGTVPPSRVCTVRMCIAHKYLRAYWMSDVLCRVQRVENNRGRPPLEPPRATMNTQI